MAFIVLNKLVGFIKISVTLLSDMWTLHLKTHMRYEGRRRPL